MGGLGQDHLDGGELDERAYMDGEDLDESPFSWGYTSH